MTKIDLTEFMTKMCVLASSYDHTIEWNVHSDMENLVEGKMSDREFLAANFVFSLEFKDNHAILRFDEDREEPVLSHVAAFAWMYLGG